MYSIELSRKAAKFYQKAENVTLKRLNLAFSKLSEDPFRHFNIRKLSGELEGSFRLRLGTMRIIYSVDDKKKVVYIEVIGFRGDVYKA
jgi:mRNA interferase RelE/StbE